MTDAVYRKLFVKKNLGFTLIELLMVIAILAILFTIIVLMTRLQLVKAQDARVRVAADDIATALNLHKQDMAASDLPGDDVYPIATDPTATLTASLSTLVTKGYLASNTPLTNTGVYLSYQGTSYSLVMKMGSKSYQITADGNGYYKAQAGKVQLAKPSPGLLFDGAAEQWDATNNKNPLAINTAGITRYSGNELTYLMWVNPTALPAATQDQGLMSRMTFTAGSSSQQALYGAGWSLALTSTGGVKLYVCQNQTCGATPAINYTTAGNLVQAGKWSLIGLRVSTNSNISAQNRPSLQPDKAKAVVTAGLGFTLFVNGVNVYGKANAVVPPWSAGYTNAKIFVGGLSGTAGSDIYPLKAAVDDIRIYSTALSTAEIVALYNNGLGTFAVGNEANLAGLWKMDEPLIGTAPNLSTKDSFGAVSSGYFRNELLKIKAYAAAGGAIPGPNNALVGKGVSRTQNGHNQGVYIGSWPDTDGQAYVIYGQ